MKPRVVVDSNIYVSAIVFGGVPKSVLTLAELGQFEICISPAIRQEVERTLNRKFGWPQERIDLACSPLWDIAVNVETESFLSITGDPTTIAIWSVP
jgi:predicted nucleic acid-binding protein